MTLLLCGCSSTNISKLAASLAKDPAIHVVKVRTIYGTVEFTRIGSPTNAMTISPDGTVSIIKPQ